MRCEDAAVDIVTSLAGELGPEAETALRRHLNTCEACRHEADRLETTWQGLGAVPTEAPDTPRMQQRFLSELDAFQLGADQARAQVLHHAPRRSMLTAVAWPAAVAASLVTGVFIGRVGPAPATDNFQELTALRHELHATQEMVSLALLNQSSAAERLRGVSWSERLKEPGADVLAALVDALAHDPNVNVRLAAIDALSRWADRPDVRHGAVAALSDRSSPMVQIALIDWLVQIKEDSSRDVLRALATDPHVDAAVRGRAEWGLSQLS
jgi:hypothetical protein